MAATFPNFWKMINAENVGLVLMLCQLKENNKNQCDPYWPHKEIGCSYEYPKNFEEKEMKITWIAESKESESFIERNFEIEV